MTIVKVSVWNVLIKKCEYLILRDKIVVNVFTH